MTEATTIKSSLELVESIKILAVEGIKITKDGLSLADLTEAVEILKHVDQFIATVKDFHNIGGEIKDLDQAELLELGTAFYEAFKSIKEA